MGSVIKADESLVINGEFEDGLKGWNRRGSALGTESDMYNGVYIRLLAASHGASVNQTISAPKTPSDKARYVISFLYELWHTRAGEVLLEVEGQAGKQPIELLPTKLRGTPEEQARLKKEGPLEFNPTECEIPLELLFTDRDTLKVTVLSPQNDPGDEFSKLRITRIRLQLHLEPAAMEGLLLDEQSIGPTDPLYVCLGTEGALAHRLEFVAEPDSVWLGTKAALTIVDNPTEAIVTTPDWGVDQPVESPWLLECPWIGDEDYVFSMKLVNQYTAEPYPLQVSLGHHRLAFLQVHEAAYYPVLEYEQSVRVGVQVASYYTNQPMSGRTVTWTVTDGRVKKVATTDVQGWAYLDYEPSLAGQFQIEASVESLYYAAGVVSQILEVRVLETDPWKDVMAVVEGAQARWEEKTGYPNRGSDYAVELGLPSDSPLLETELSLHWSGDSPEQLGVTVAPALDFGVPVTGTGLTWTLTSADDLDGRFDLDLVCSKLLLPSPKKAMSLARNLVRIGDVRGANKFPIVDENESVLLRVQVVHVVIAGDGDPVVNALVEWRSEEGLIFAGPTGNDGWASVLYQPSSAGDKAITVSVKAHADAIAVEHVFNVNAIATSPWKNEVKIFLNGVEVQRNTLGLLCRRGQTHPLKVVPNDGSSWIGKNISLHWRGAEPDIGLVPSDLGIAKPLLGGGAEWSLASSASSSISSLFELELRLESVTVVRELSGRLVSVDLAEEVNLRLDQVVAELDEQSLFPCLGARHRFSVLPNALSPLVGLESRLVWSGAPAADLDATVEPALAVAQPVTDGGVIWMLDFTASEQSGQFALAWTMPQLDFVSTAKPMKLAHNKVRIEDWRDTPIDPVVGQDSAWLWVQVFSHFTDLAVDQVPVNWTAGGGAEEEITDATGWCGFALAPSNSDALEVTASVLSPYDGFEDKRALQVTPLADDPWSGLTVQFDEQPPQRWGEKTYFPRRNGTHHLKLQAPETSPLLDHEVTLGLTGTGPVALGLGFSPPALGVPKKLTREGLSYTFKVNDIKDGSFALRLSATRLANLSPANAMSVGEGAQVLNLVLSSSTHRILDWGSELYTEVKLLSTITGKPMQGWTVTWRSPDLGEVTSVTNYYGVASVRFVPATPGEARLTATVGEKEYSKTVELSYALNEPREIASLTSPKPSGHLGEQVSAVVTVVSALTGEPLQGVEVMWDYPTLTLAPTSTDGEGLARVEFRLPGVRRGLLGATVRGGYAGWEVKLLEFELLPNELTWQQDFKPNFTGSPAGWSDVRLRVFAGKVYTLKLDYRDSWLIGDPDAQLLLEYKPGEEAQGVVVDPPLGQLVAMEEGTTSLSWTLTTDPDYTPDHAFALQFDMPLISEMPKSPPLPGIIRDENSWLEEFTFYLNGEEFELAYRDLHLVDGTDYTWELRVKEGSSLIGTTTVALGASLGNPNVEFAPPLFQPQPVTMTTPLIWSISTKESNYGTFMVELRCPDLPVREISTEVKP